MWLKNPYTGDKDPKNGVESKSFPKYDGEEGNGNYLRRQEKESMKQNSGPYQAFDNFYPLREVIDTYLEIWYKDSSGSESD